MCTHWLSLHTWYDMFQVRCLLDAGLVTVRCLWCCGLKWFRKLDGDYRTVFGEEDVHAASAESLGIGKGVRRALTSKASLSRCQPCSVQRATRSRSRFNSEPCFQRVIHTVTRCLLLVVSPLQKSVAELERDERDRSHTSWTVWKPDRCQVLGGACSLQVGQIQLLVATARTSATRDLCLNNRAVAHAVRAIEHALPCQKLCLSCAFAASCCTFGAKASNFRSSGPS